MMWGYGQGPGWWIWAVLLLLGIALLVWLAVRAFGGGIGGSGTGARRSQAGPPGTLSSTARQILDERFARGELTADQYREQLRVLGEGR
ncbi:SHOCT domain-containing protein [Pseudarthrobacter sp. LT1]|uniref:SHOCT domain-containing protein n=1 Tax=Pseudarthrobacter sp. LT1 TaxID=3111450 RepID=UPI002D793044|nr:SHOCT domain-containing protein [Pseudarthrobacter sp. LT1]WRT13088.1 SHOCT domain-containing protein [Pseudarthrobacter sp. LT1]